MADTQEFVSRLESHILSYTETHSRPMTLSHTAESLSILLYERRILPYYLQVLLVGVDSAGQGGVYSYDPVGHCEKVPYRLHGTAAKFMLASMSCLLSPHEAEEELIDLSPVEATKIIQDLYASCTAVDPSTGGWCEIWILKRRQEQCEVICMMLRQD